MSESDTYIELEEFEDNFARVPRFALADKNLSLKAKGLYAYLAALPKNWKLYRSQMLNHLADGKDSLNAAFKELEKFGYLVSTPVRLNGQFKGYKLKIMIRSLFNTDEIEPMRKNRNGESVNGKPDSDKSASINNNSNKKNGSNTFSKEKDSISETLFDLEQVDKKEKSSGKKEKGIYLLFKDSQEYDINILIKRLESFPSLLALQSVNFEYYHSCAEVWSKAKRKKSADWGATIRNFMLKDIKEKKLVTNDMDVQISTVQDILDNYEII